MKLKKHEINYLEHQEKVNNTIHRTPWIHFCNLKALLYSNMPSETPN